MLGDLGKKGTVYIKAKVSNFQEYTVLVNVSKFIHQTYCLKWDNHQHKMMLSYINMHHILKSAIFE